MAGLLGDIFSAGNVAKRKMRDLLGNPVASAQQFAGNVNDRARNLNQMTTAAAQEKDLYGPATQRLGSLLAEAYNPMGITVFHGSPAKFNRFDKAKIGSGEGAQAYGYGHYTAESPDVARRYQMALTQERGMDVTYNGKPLSDLYSKIENKSFKLSGKAADIENQKLQLVEHMMLDKSPQELIPYAKETGFDKSVVDWLEKDVSKNTQIPGAFYEIDLPDEQIARMLDYDKPLGQQPQAVKDFLAAQGRPVLDTFQRLNKNPTTKGVYRTINDMPGKTLLDVYGQGGNAEEMLRQAGIPGIRYLDEGSRGTGQGTSNFVVFPGNEDLLTILKRNGGLLD